MTTIRSLQSFWRDDSPGLIVAGRVVVVALGMVSAPIIARAIGPAGRGETATSAALFYIVPVILALGVPIEVRRRMSVDAGSRILQTVQLYCALLLPLALAMAFICFETIFSSFSATARYVASATLLLAPLTVSWMCNANALLALGQMRRFFAVQVVQPAVYLVCVVAVWAVGVASTATVLGASGVATIATFITASVLSRRRREGERIGVLGMLRAGVRFSGAAIAEALLNRLDQVLAVPLIGAAQAGLYSVAVTIGSAPIAFAHALGARYFPLVAKASEGGSQELHETKGLAARASLAMGLMIAVGLAAATPLVVPLVFGAEFAPAVPVTLVMLAGSIVMASAFVCSMLLAAVGRGLRMTAAQVAAAAVNVALLLALGRAYGAMGAAVASSVAYLTLLMASSGLLGLRPRDWALGAVDFRRAVRDVLGKSTGPGATG